MVKKQRALAATMLLFSVSFILSFLYLLSQSANKAIHPSDTEITTQRYYYESLDDTDTIDSILSSKNLIRVEDNKVPTGFGPQAYWHKLTIQNSSDQSKHLSLFLDNCVIAELDIYGVVGDEIIDSKFLGNTRWQSDLDLIALPSFDFSIPSKSEISIIIRSQSQGSAHVPMILFHQDEFKNYKDLMFILWGAFIGLVFIMAIYNIILYNGVRDSVYLFYVGYILSILTDMSMLHGFSVFIFPKSVVEFFVNNLTALHYFIIFFGLSFALKFLKFDLDQSNTYKQGSAIAYLLIPFAISSIFIKEYIAVQIYFVIQTLVYLYIFGLLAVKFRDNFSWAKYYFISWLPVYVGGTITPSFFVGTLEYSFWARNALLVSIMMEASLMALALANRLKANEENLLFNLTHETFTGLANSSKMSKVLTEFTQLKGPNHGYAIIIADVDNYHDVSPYLNDKQVKSLMENLVCHLTEKIQNLPLIHFDHRTHDCLNTCFLLAEGSLGFAVKQCDLYKIKKAIETTEKSLPILVEAGNMHLFIHCTFGISFYSDGQFPQEVANKAAQAAKSARQMSEPYMQYDESRSKLGHRQIQLAADLQKALQNNELNLFHQPQVCMSDQTTFGSEALLRWQHPKLGFIPPDEFIKIAEDTGMINQISLWVIRTALNQQHTLLAYGFNFHMAINLSALDILNDGICDFIISYTSQLNIPHELMVIEITETMDITDQHRFKNNLDLLADAGFKIAMDDFGTGYSTLSYLCDYPINELKIDKSLIMGLDQAGKNMLIVLGALSMAKSLGIKVVAEGVENEAVLKELKLLECDIVQGYHYAKPMPFDEYVNWLSQTLEKNLITLN